MITFRWVPTVRLLDEMLEKYPVEIGLKLMDLGCGKGLTTLYLAEEQMRIYLQWIYGLVQRITISSLRNEQYEITWKDWFASKHPYAICD